MFSNYRPERSVVIALLALQSVGLLCVTLFAVGSMSTTSVWIGTIATTLLIVSLGLYVTGFEWARLISAVILPVLVGLFMPEPFVTHYSTIALMIVPLMAMVLTSPAWVIFGSVLQILLLLWRAGFTGVYTDPLIIALYATVVGSLVIAHVMTNMARSRAEEQSRLLSEEHALLEQRVEERTRELAVANMELREATRMRDLFLASVSHELRTPLNIILGSVELLREEIYGGLTARQHKSLETVSENGQHLLHLINDILDLAKMEAGSFEIDSDEVQVRELCEQCARMIAPEAQRKGLLLELSVEEGLDRIPGDYRRLRQVLLNLLSNAVKFTPSGSIGLEASFVGAGEVVEFAVWDTGIGIERDRQQLLFRPFAQLDRRLSRQYEGTGLGLALVAQLVTRHGGEVGVSSAIGEGSRFWVRLPAFRPEAIPEAA